MKTKLRTYNYALEKIYWEKDYGRPQAQKKDEVKKEYVLAVLGSDFLTSMLSFDFYVFFFYEKIIETAVNNNFIDYIIVESCADSEPYGWEQFYIENSPANLSLRKILKKSKERKIKSVFLYNEDEEAYSVYSSILSDFDCVVTPSKGVYEYLKNKNYKVLLIDYYVHPRFFNPVRRWRESECFSNSHTITYNGWPDIDRNKIIVKDLLSLSFKIKVFDSKNKVFRSKVKSDEKIEFIGCTDQSGLANLIQGSLCHVLHEDSFSSRSELRFYALQAMACGVPLIFLTSSGKSLGLDMAFYPGELCVEEAAVEIKRLQIDSLYRKRVAHINWRIATEKKNCKRIFSGLISKIDGKYPEVDQLPLCSLIAPTYRPENIPNIIENYVTQTYPNKELVIVCNGFVCKEDFQFGAIKVLNVPKNRYASEVMNFGIGNANGEYVFRFDDDDPYCSNYIKDMVLMNLGVNADFFGKAPKYFLFDDALYIRKNKCTPLSYFYTNEVGKIWISGHSLSGKKDVFTANMYPSFFYSASDSALMLSLKNKTYKCALFDEFNLAAYRSDNSDDHTWKIERADIEKKSERCSYGFEHLVV